MAVNFKDLLGEKYTDEIASVLEGVSDKLLLNDGSYIPKTRFDEVNKNLKDAKSELDSVRKSQMTEEEKHKADIEALEAEKRNYLLKSNRLDVQKVFQDAGMKVKDSFIDGIVGEDLEKSLAIAKDLVDDYNTALAEKNAEIEQLKLKSTPNPKIDPNGGEFKKLTMTEQAQLRAKDPAAYEAYIQAEDSQENKS